MSYYGDSASEKAAMRLEAKIKRIYAEAARDVEQKILHYTDTFKKRDAEMQKKLKNGEISQADYDNWKSRIVFRGKRWNSVRDTIWSQLYHTRQTTTDMINGERKAMFQNVVNYSQYQIDKDFNFSLSFNIYDNATVTRLIKEDPDLVPDVKYPVPGRDYAWSKKQIASAATQGVIQGESIPEISRRIANKLSSANMVSMTRCARTAMTGAHNSGRIEAMHNAEDLGIKVQKLWIATLDSRTRDWHRDLDGQLAEVDEPFYSHFGEIMYPGDPNARPANVWNCRCSLGWEYPEYKNQYDTRAAREEEANNGGQVVEIPYMSYNKWVQWVKDGKPEIKKEIPKPKEPEIDQVIQNFLKECEQTKIKYHEVKKLDTDWANDNGIWAMSEIFERLHGGDLTSGSCASLALAYAGNRCGYDVIDFRGGASQTKFSSGYNLRKIFNATGVETITEKDTNDIKACERLFEQMKDDKEYILCTGKHASIVRKQNGSLQYLELQSATNGGWHDFEKDTLKWRFGCQRSHSTYGMKYERSNELVDVESFKNFVGFDKVLGYINTPENEQKKGREGHEK